MRIGLYGGSFDPVHWAHLWVARAAMEEVGLDELVFIPASQSPFKPGGVQVDGATRARMLRLALAGWQHCRVDEQELHRGGVSYTIETIRSYRTSFPNAQLFYLIGADHVPTLHLWREAKTLAQWVTFVIIPRPNKVSALPDPPFQAQLLKGISLEISSSKIRQRVAQNRPISGLTPDPVVEIIEKLGLYRTEVRAT